MPDNLLPQTPPRVTLRVVLLPRGEKALVFDLTSPPATVVAWGPEVLPFDAPVGLNRDRLASRYGCPEIEGAVWENLALEIALCIRPTVQVLEFVVSPAGFTTRGVE